MPISWWVGSENVVHLHYVVLFNCKETWNCDICGEMALENTVLTLKANITCSLSYAEPSFWLSCMWERVCRVQGTRQESREGRKASLGSGEEQKPWMRISGVGILKQGLGRIGVWREGRREPNKSDGVCSREVAQQLGALIVPPEDSGSIPCTYIHLTTICDSCSRRSNAISGLFGYQACVQIYTCRQSIHVCKIKWNIFNTSKIIYFYLVSYLFSFFETEFYCVD